MGVALLGSVKIPLARRLQIDEARVGGLVSMFGFAMIPVILTMGVLTDHFGPQIVSIVGSFLMVASLLVLAGAGSYLSALLAVLLLSAGWSALVNVLNVLMLGAFGHSDVFAMNLGNTFFGLGAFLTPLVIASLLKRAGLARAVLVLACLALVSGLLAFGVDFGELAERAETIREEAAADKVGSGEEAGEPREEAALDTAAGFGALLVDPIMWLTALALLFYAPMEATMAAWATTYLGDKGVSEGRAATLLSAFWLAFMCSRLATALVVAAVPWPPWGDTVLIIALSIFCVLVWAGAVFSPGRGMAITMVVLAGLVFGPTFPTIVGVLVGHVSPALAGRAVGLFFAIGGIGWTIIPMMIGAYARKTSVQRGFLVAVAASVGLTVMAVALHFANGA
jgi:fucose permease